ncbi:acetyl-CoA carboxylase, biotin carboxyl carrier protein [cyanobacterium TDX16]|nr:acetyl-CoA carboxylase, biotin carboxyl carrier protein [cyanobacterium TDX16]
MEIDEIKTLTDLMVEHDLSEIMIRDGEKRILLRRGELKSAAVAHHAAAVSHAPQHHAAPAPPPPAPVATVAPVAPAADPGLGKITSPMVGTFYATPDPESPPFVKIGDRVTPDSVVCVIEAMKVFNEIKAEVTGTIESIEVRSGAPVEFGQVLMTVRAS